jgi:WD40 repeat protein
VIRIWSTAGGPPVAVLRGQRSGVFDIGFGAASDRVVSAGDDGTVRIWDAGQTQSWTGAARTENVEFNPDGRLIASGSDDGTVRVWDTATGRLRASLRGSEGYTTGRFSPTADSVVIASDGGSRVLNWPVSADRAQLVARLPSGRGMSAARFDSTGDRIVYVDYKKSQIAVHSLQSGREVKLGGASKEVQDAQLSPDGKHLAAVPATGDVQIWRLDRPARPERVLKGHHGDVNSIAYSRDGSIVTAGADRTVRVWDPRGGPAVVLRGDDDEITTAIFTPDGRRVLSSSHDGTLRLWDARRGVALAVLQSGGGPLFDVAVSRDGKIATLGEGEVVRIFECAVCGSLRSVRALARSRGARALTPEEKRRFLAAAG